jgi:succinate-semialdehyde dehydrogenase/glutarate-semialdehyde dehydrogenase
MAVGAAVDQDFIEQVPQGLYVGGAWREATGGRTLAVEDPRVLGEEIFGPVAPVRTFAAEDEAVAAANDTEYGLVAYIFTRDVDRAFRVGARLETGMVGLNQGIVSNPAAPFGGVKASGFGREGGREGIEEYLSTKYIAVASR